MSGNVLANFHVEKILNNNTNRKTVSILGEFRENNKTEQAVIVLEKKAFREEEFVEDKYFKEVSRTEEQFVNDIYGNYELSPGEEFNSESKYFGEFQTRG